MPLLTELENNVSGSPCYNHAAPDRAIASLIPGVQPLPRRGAVSVQDKLVRFTRPGLTEEYSVSVDGVRQDLIIESPPLNSHPLRCAPATTDSSAETRSAASPQPSTSHCAWSWR